MKRKPLDRRAPLRAKTELRRSTPLERPASMTATQRQRAAVAGTRASCAGPIGESTRRLIPRSLGGCGDPLRVVADRRPCHRAYDRGELDLLPYPEPAWADPARARRRARRPARSAAQDQRRDGPAANEVRDTT